MPLFTDIFDNKYKTTNTSTNLYAVFSLVTPILGHIYSYQKTLSKWWNLAGMRYVLKQIFKADTYLRL